MNVKLKDLDIMGKEIQFKVEGSEKYKTNLGALFTLLLVVISLVSIWFFGKDIIYKESPSFISKRLMVDEDPSFNVTNLNFFYAFKLTDNNFVSIGFELAVPVALYNYLELNATSGTYNNAYTYFPNITKCSRDLIDNKTFVEEGLETYYCINKKNLNEKLIGRNGRLISGYLMYAYLFCSKANEATYNIKS